MASIPLANWNGEEMPLDRVAVSPLDRGFVFGDGIYEVIRVYQGKPWLCDEHVDRLRRSLREIRIDCDVDRLCTRMHATLANSKVLEGTIYIQVTRGTAPRTHKFPEGLKPNELIYINEYPVDPYIEMRANGARVITQPDIRWSRCDVKSLNLLANVLACQAAAEADCQEALFVDREGRVTEATHSSVFGIQQGKLVTPPLKANILPGITRRVIFDLARREKIDIIEGMFMKSDLFELDEVFLTGTGIEVVGIVEVDKRPVRNGKPGPVTRRLEKAYRQAIVDWLADQEGGTQGKGSRS